MKWRDCQPGSDKSQSTQCNDFRYSIIISSGIGFIFLGNIYDNIEKPRQLTAILLLILSFTTLIEAIFSDQMTEQTQSKVQVALTLFQMSSVFEAGVSLACIVILHNWFKEEVLGTISAFWMSSYFLQVIFENTIYDAQHAKDLQSGSEVVTDDDANAVAYMLKVQSYILFACYLVAAVVVWFIYYHHPSHIGIKIRVSKTNEENFGFNEDTTSAIWTRNSNAGRNINSTVTGQNTTHNQQSTVAPNMPQQRYMPVGDDGLVDRIGQEDVTGGSSVQKMDVTLIDAFKIKELNLLIFSYVFKTAHNLLILKTDHFTGNSYDERTYATGSILGVILAGTTVDLVFKKNRFLSIFVLNLILICFDVFLFTINNTGKEAGSISYPFIFFLGAVLSSSNLIYLVLLPMLIAKQHSERMMQLQHVQRVCYAGTIAGVVLALCQIGRFLFSDNLATFLHYLMRNSDVIWIDVTTVLLLLISTLIIWGPISKEIKQTGLWQRCCMNRGGSIPDIPESTQFEQSPTSRMYANSGTFQRSPTSSFT